MSALHAVRTSRHHPDLIRAYLEYTSELEAPDIFHQATAYWMIASTLRRRVWMDMGHFIYTPNQFFILVAPPGVLAKSTTIGIGRKLLKELPEITFGPDSSTWQAFFETLTLAQREEVFGDPKDLMADRQISAPITLAVSELGSFLDMDEGQLVNLLIDFWDGQTGSFNRTTRKDGSVTVLNPLVNLIGCTTDAWMQENFKSSLLEGGLGSRILFVHEKRKRRLVAYPHLSHNADRHQRLQNALLDDLRVVSKLWGPMELTQEATDFGHDFYLRHNGTPPTGEHFDGYHTRKFVHLHKLAMVNSIAQSSDLVVRVEHLQSALEFLDRLERGIAATTAIVKASGSTQGSRIAHLRTLIAGHKELTLATISRIMVSKMNSKELDQALNDLTRGGEIEKTISRVGTTIKWKG